MTSDGAGFDDEYLDDPITLIDFEQARINAITKDFVSAVNHSESLDLVTENSGSSNGRNHFILPVTFFDISSNLKLLNQCRPVAIKIVDCDKHPWYYKKYKIHSSLRLTDMESNVLENSNNYISSGIMAINNNSTSIDINNENIGKVSNGIIVFNRGKKMEYFKSRDDMEKKVAVEMKNASKIDFKRNVGLVGLKITPRINVTTALTSNVNRQNMSKDILVTKGDNYLLGVDKALHNLGTTTVPLNNKEPINNKVSNKGKPEKKLNYHRIKWEERKRKRKEKLQQLMHDNDNSTLINTTNPTTKPSCHVKDKTKTNKYLNDLLKKKSALENKRESLQNMNKCCGNSNASEITTAVHIEQDVGNNDLLFKALPVTPIDPGIKSPLLPCYKISKSSSDKIKLKNVVGQRESTTENCTANVTPRVIAVNQSDLLVNSKEASINDTQCKSIPLSTEVQNLSQNSLKDIVISNIVSIPKNTQNAMHNTDSNQSEVPITNDNVPTTVSTYKISKSNNKNHEGNNIIKLKKCSEKYNKIPGTSIMIIPKENATSTKKITGFMPPKQKISQGSNKNNMPMSSHVSQVSTKPNQDQNTLKSTNNMNVTTKALLNYHHFPIPTHVSSRPDQVHVMQKTASNMSAVMNTLPARNTEPYHNPVSLAHHANFIPNNYAHCPDPHKANFEQVNTSRHLNTQQQSFMNYNTKDMFWPYWPPLPPPLPPPPPPPPPYPEKRQNKNQSQPSIVPISNIEVIAGKGMHSIDSGSSFTTPNNLVDIINTDNNNIKVSNSCKIALETTVKPVNSKSEMLEELDKEIMTIPKDILSKEDTAQKLINAFNISKRLVDSPEKHMSYNVVNNSPNSLRNVRPGSKKLKLNIQNEMKSYTLSGTTQSNLSTHYPNQKSTNDSFMDRVAISSTQDNLIGRSVNNILYKTDNNTNSQKGPFGFLLGTKINDRHNKIARISPIVGLEPNAVLSGRIEKKASTEKLRASKGYSPPILPIPTYENSLQILCSNNAESQVQLSAQPCGKRINNIPLETFYLPPHKKTCTHNKVERKRHLDNNIKTSKKISLGEYKERTGIPITEFHGTTDTLPYKQMKRKDYNTSKSIKTLSELVNPISEQDLGYDSDSTVKL